jgi:hypothetical protein
MSEEWRQFWKWMPCGMLGVALASMAVAGPPSSRGELLSRSTGDPNTGRIGGYRAGVDRAVLSRLDLRAPADLPAASETSAKPHALTEDSPAFPAMRRTSDDPLRSGNEDTATRAKLEEGLPSLGSNVRPRGRVEEMAHRFRQEGLPVARLFENHSALVSLGLNQRGKPGIWLIQKIP